MGQELQLLKSLSNGLFQSGEFLAKQLGVSRTTIWKEMKQLEEQYGLEFHSVKGRGYRLAMPIELLDESEIYSAMPEHIKKSLDKVEVLPVVDSTNRYLMAAASQGSNSGRLLFAEQQTAGRGRQGRIWVSPFGCNLYCSLLWQFELAATVLSGLGIVIAVAVARTLERLVEGIQIKWPNDILYDGKKLAGILLEMQGEASGPAAVVIGVGINVRMPDKQKGIDQAWTDLFQIKNGFDSRNELACALTTEMIQAIQTFESEGLGSFIHTWSERDFLIGKHIDIVLANKQISGIARGIDNHGALQLEVDGTIKHYMAGEVSVKKRW